MIGFYKSLNNFMDSRKENLTGKGARKKKKAKSPASRTDLYSQVGIGSNINFSA